MITKWNEYQNINENLQKARSILRRANVPETNEDFVKLRALLSAHRGYLGKFTEWLINAKVPYSRLEDLYDQMKDKRLSKPIDEFKTPEEIIDTIIRTSADIAVNQMIHAIPSRARDYLMFSYCDKCDNEKEITCTRCDGDGTEDCKKCEGDTEVSCPKCAGEGTKTCKKCKGKGTYYRRECDECEGEGEVYCDECQGNCSIECDECKGEGNFNCKLCDGDCAIKCPECAEGNESTEWKEFVKFLALQAPHKDIIIDFLSKKGGRYSNENNDWDYQDQTALEELTEVITRLVDIPSIDAIIEKLPNEENLKLIHNDDKYLIVACNYKGIQKYGSSYWCIHQDEDTFDDYVYQRGGICEQWIMYVKGKTPFVDEKSVMGITYDIKDGVEYAHWEDDYDCVRDARRILSSLKLDRTLIFDALAIFNHEDVDSGLLLKYVDVFKPKIDAMFLDTLKAINDLAVFKSTANKLTARQKQNSIREIEERKYQIYEMLCNYLFEECDSWNDDIYRVLTELCVKNKMVIPVPENSDMAVVAVTKMYEYFEFIWGDDCYEDIFETLSDNDISGKEAYDLIIWATSKGYKIEKYLNSRYMDEDYALPLYRLKLITFDKFIKSVDLNNVGEFEGEIVIAVLDNITSYMSDRRFKKFIDLICNFLSKDNKLLLQYKSTLLDVISKINEKGIIENILDKIDDDDIEMACARKLLHKKILTKYDVDMKKKMLEKVITSYKLFIK